ncbi:hypothetical protein JCM10295v2_001244 [Rhodotorula toruloides]
MSVAKELTDSTFDTLKVELDAILSTRRIVSDEYTRLVKDVESVRQDLFDPVPALDEFHALPPVQALFHIDSVEQVGKVTPPTSRKRSRREALFVSVVMTLAKMQKTNDFAVIANGLALRETPPASAETLVSAEPQGQLLPVADMQEVLDQPDLFKDEILPRAISLFACWQCNLRDPLNVILHHNCQCRRPTSLRPGSYYIYAEDVKATIEVILSPNKDL